MTDWTKYSVVRDKVGDLWVNVADDLWSGYGDFPGDELEIRFGPLTPVLDADGLPVVRTVGDLTARHIGLRVRVDATPDAYRIVEGMLTHLCALEDEIVLTIADDESVAALECTLATPCEVLDA